MTPKTLTITVDIPAKHRVNIHKPAEVEIEGISYLADNQVPTFIMTKASWKPSHLHNVFSIPLAFKYIEETCNAKHKEFLNTQK